MEILCIRYGDLVSQCYHLFNCKCTPFLHVAGEEKGATAPTKHIADRPALVLVITSLYNYDWMQQKHRL